MRLAMVVNDGKPVVASLLGAGYLNAHINLSDRPQENKRENSATIAGFETRDSETVHLQWPSVNLEIGDVVQLRVLPDGEGDDPSERRNSSESPDNLFTRAELAKELVQAVSEFEHKLREISAKSKELEPPEEHKKFMRARGRVIWELGQILLSPAHRRHKELIPQELRGELL